MNRKILQDIINDAARLGLPEEYAKESKEFLEYNEYALSLETVAIQLQENQIKIDKSLYEKMKRASEQMKMSLDNISFLHELVD